MDMETTPRGVFASRKQALSLSRDKRIQREVKAFLAKYRSMKGSLSVVCNYTGEPFTAASNRRMTCFTFLASHNLGHFQFKLTLTTMSGEIHNIGKELLRATDGYL